MVATGFGPKMAWLAVRDGDPLGVMKALGLRDLGTVDARPGLDLAHFTDDRVVVAAVPGWVLVAGRWLFGFHGTAALSVTLGTASSTTTCRSSVSTTAGAPAASDPK